MSTQWSCEIRFKYSEDKMIRVIPRSYFSQKAFRKVVQIETLSAVFNQSFFIFYEAGRNFPIMFSYEKYSSDIKLKLKQRQYVNKQFVFTLNFYTSKYDVLSEFLTLFRFVMLLRYYDQSFCIRGPSHS